MNAANAPGQPHPSTAEHGSRPPAHASAERLGGGSAPQPGTLDVVFGVRDGRTIVVAERAVAPLAFRSRAGVRGHADGGASGTILTLGGGVLCGQVLHSDIAVQEGARATVGTVGATLVHGGPSGVSRQEQRFRVASGGVLAYLPGAMIPCRGACFTQETHATLDPGAAFLYAEVVGPGRLWHGECFAYRRLILHLSVNDRRGPLLLDRLLLEPASFSPSGPGVLGGYTHLGTLAAFGPGTGPDLAARLHHLLLGQQAIIGSASPLARDGVLVRILGSRAHDVAAALGAATSCATSAIIVARAASTA